MLSRACEWEPAAGFRFCCFRPPKLIDGGNGSLVYTLVSFVKASSATVDAAISGMFDTMGRS